LLSLTQLEPGGLCTEQGLGQWFIPRIARSSVRADEWSARLLGLGEDNDFWPN